MSAVKAPEQDVLESEVVKTLPWRDLQIGMQAILNADFLAKEFRRGARYKLADQDVNDRRASIISFLTQVGPQSVNELAQKLEQHKAAVSALLIRMERDGLIEFTPNKEDKRSKSAALTEKGRVLSAPIRTAFQELHDVAVEGVSRRDMEITMDVLLRMIANLSEANRRLADQPANR